MKYNPYLNLDDVPREKPKTKRNVTPWIDRYRKRLAAPSWQLLRQQVFARCNGVCEKCGERPATQVHHLHYKTLGCETPACLQGFCFRCHDETHGGRLSRKGQHNAQKRTETVSYRGLRPDGREAVSVRFWAVLGGLCGLAMSPNRVDAHPDKLRNFLHCVTLLSEVLNPVPFAKR